MVFALHWSTHGRLSGASFRLCNVILLTHELLYLDGIAGTGFAFVAAALEQGIEFSKRTFVLLLRKNLSASLVQRLMANDNFYYLHNPPLSSSKVNSKGQGTRTGAAGKIKQGELAVLLSEDVEQFATAVGDIFSTLFKPLVQISAFSVALTRLVGTYVAAIFLAYVFVGFMHVSGSFARACKYTNNNVLKFPDMLHMLPTLHCV